MVTISKNSDKGGIELSFPSKPADEVLAWIKTKGFGWSKYNKVWWRKWNESTWKEVHEYFQQPVPEITDENINTMHTGQYGDESLFHGVTANEFILLDITASLKAFARNEALKRNNLLDQKDKLKASLVKKKLMLKNGAINDMGRVVRKQIIASGDYISSSYYSGYDKFIAAHWTKDEPSIISTERPSAWITNTSTWNSIIHKIQEKHGGKEIDISEQFTLGREIEKEHTSDPLEQTRIAYDHIWEDPKYYTKAKPANWAEKELGEGKKDTFQIAFDPGSIEKGKNLIRVVNFKHDVHSLSSTATTILDFEFQGKFYEYKYNSGTGYGFAFITEFKSEKALENKLSRAGEQEQIYSSSEPEKNTELGTYLQMVASAKVTDLKAQPKKADPEKPVFWKWTKQQFRDYWIDKYMKWKPETAVIKSSSSGKWYATRPDGTPTTAWATKKAAIEKINAEKLSNISFIRNGNFDWEHKSHIENAINAGEEIPEKVLADYPELNKQAKPAPDKKPASANIPGTIRPDFSEVLKGRDIEISMPNGEKRKAYFAITELNDIIASHNEENFHSDPAYPKNASGNNINDRNYKDDLSAQKAVMDYARELEPERLITTSRTPSGTPIITKDGFVVSGNNRTMSLKLAAKDHPENYKTYKKFLAEEIESFGFSFAELLPIENNNRLLVRDSKGEEKQFTYPVLVRVDLDFPEYTTQELAKYNKDTKKAERPVDKAIKLSNILRENSRCADIIAEITGEYETFSEFYGNIAGQKKLAKTLIECNLLTEQEMPAYFSDTTFTETGKEFIENLLAALVLNREALMAAEQPGIKAIRQKLITSLPVLMKNATLPEGSLISYINDAVIFQHIMKTSGSEFVDFIRQANLFGTKYNRKTVYMNRLINQGKLVFKSCIEKYNAAVIVNQGPTLFGGKPTNDDLFNQFIKKYIDPTEQRLIEKSDLVTKEEVFGTFAGQVPAESMEKAWKENTPIKEVFEAAGEEYPEEKPKVNKPEEIKNHDQLMAFLTSEGLSILTTDADTIAAVIDKNYNRSQLPPESMVFHKDKKKCIDKLIQYSKRSAAKISQPWQMTLETFATYKFTTEASAEFSMMVEALYIPVEQYREQHKKQLLIAIENNELIPAVVLADYPELKQTDSNFARSKAEEMLSELLENKLIGLQRVDTIEYLQKHINDLSPESRYAFNKWRNEHSSYPGVIPEQIMGAKEYFTKRNAPDNIKDRFGVSKTQDRTIIEAVPKKFDSKLPDGEEVYIVDGKYVRDNIYSDFSQGGNDMAYPEFVPIGELWVEEAMLDEKDHILRHEKRERDLMVNAGYIHGVNETEALTYEEAHEIVKNQEDKERGIEIKNDKYVILNQNYISIGKGSIGKVISKPNMFVTLVYFGKNQTGQVLQAKIDNTYLTTLKEVPELVKDGQSEKYVIKTVIPAPAEKTLKRLTKENKDTITRSFLKHVTCGHYLGEYEFDTNTGLSLNWGKYGYNVDQDAQDADIADLHRACKAFNKEWDGTYFCYAEYSDTKFNSVNIMDLYQVATHNTLYERIATESEYAAVFAKMQEYGIKNESVDADIKKRENIKIQTDSKLAKIKDATGYEITASQLNSIDPGNKHHFGLTYKVIIHSSQKIGNEKVQNKEFNSAAELFAYLKTKEFIDHLIWPSMYKSYILVYFPDRYFEFNFSNGKRIGTKGWMNIGPFFTDNIASESEAIEIYRKELDKLEAIYYFLTAQQQDKGHKPAPEMNVTTTGPAPAEKILKRLTKETENIEPEKKLNPYIAIFNSKQYELYADSLYTAKQKAIEYFKPAKSKEHLVYVHIAEEEQPKAEVTVEQFALLRKWMPKGQIDALMSLIRSEEREAGIEIINKLTNIIDTMPKSYETDSIKADDKIVYLHYFKGASDFYIVERDKGMVQYQAFGYAILNDDRVNAEWGYISIVDLIQNNVELDFYWQPKPFKEIIAKKDKIRQSGPGAELLKLWDEHESDIMEGLPDNLKIVKEAGGAYRLLAYTREGNNVGIIELYPEFDIHSYSPAYKEHLDQVVLRLDFYKNLKEMNEKGESIEKPAGSRSQFLDSLHELDMWRFFPEPDGKGREYRKFILSPENERAVTDLGIKERLSDTTRDGKPYIEAIISVRMGDEKTKNLIEEAYQASTGIETVAGTISNVYVVSERPVNKGKDYIILMQNKLDSQMRSVTLSKDDIQKYNRNKQSDVDALWAMAGVMKNQPVKLPIVTYNGKKYYVDFKLQEIRDTETVESTKFTDIKSDELKAAIRFIRAESGPNVNMPGLDDIEETGTAKIPAKWEERVNEVFQPNARPGITAVINDVIDLYPFITMRTTGMYHEQVRQVIGASIKQEKDNMFYVVDENGSVFLQHGGSGRPSYYSEVVDKWGEEFAKKAKKGGSLLDDVKTGKQDKTELKPISLDADVIALLDYLDSQASAKDKAKMWNEGQYDSDDKPEIASRSRIIKGLGGSTLWQIASRARPVIEVKGAGDEDKIFWFGSTLKQFIKKELREKGYELVDPEPEEMIDIELKVGPGAGPYQYKPAWNYTKAEFMQRFKEGKLLINTGKASGYDKGYTVDDYNQMFNIETAKSKKEAAEEFHYTAVFNAYQANENIPEQVKADYPEIFESVSKTDKSVSKTDIFVTQADYKNEFELNKAIEALLDRKWNDKRESWSDDELAFIKGYSGYGGLDDLSVKAGVKLDIKSLFEYFTPDQVIEKMWGLAYKYGYKDGPILEPSCGIGRFFDRRFISNTVEKHGYEINKYSAKICKLLYPEAIINDGKDIKFFEQLFIVNNYTVRAKVTPKYSLVIGNPPYGPIGGEYMGMGESSYTHAKNFIDYFILRGLDLVVKGGLLVYIIGSETAAGGVPFLDQNMNKAKEMIIQRGKLIDAYRLPSGVFARTDVTSDIVVFRKR